MSQIFFILLALLFLSQLGLSFAEPVLLLGSAKPARC